ncbi:hypothetical protein P4O66_008334 [Electrophorus voltai]|uniref:ribonuclease H n=1 Tax=Electrophorus voltai TaxID=2609070 RepID=A0AAD8ZG81_9TELE|nr:hypothetical protein P4O66_008334 [Electrophorus voltai]
MLQLPKPRSGSSHGPGGPDLSRVPQEYWDLGEAFSKQKAQLMPPHRPYDMAINLLLGSIPPRGCLFSLSGPECQAMDEYIQESLALGLFRLSTSPGFFFVGKKDGGLHPCIDYQGLNKITIKDCYTLPLMTSAFEKLQQASIFTKLDLRSAYNLVRIQEGDKWKTVFITPSGHYEYLIMPFGLRNAPALFQQYITEVLREALDRYVFIYLDNILIYSQTEDKHVTHVRRVLQLLLENYLFIKLEKSTFHAQTISFLGFIVSLNTLRMDPAKVRAVESWPRPTSVRLVQCFLGFTNFYQRNYDVGNRELLAVKLVRGVEKLAGGGKTPLPGLDGPQKLGLQTCRPSDLICQARWGLFFAWFDFTLYYRPGTKNIKPDTLSRRWESSLPSAPP